MLDTSVTSTENGPPTLINQPQSTRPHLWQRISLGVILLISIFMNFYQLGQNGFGNLFYASGVRSMADSLHNFFFVSYDPGGFVTLDKPPLGFWLQAISVKIFGFTPFSIFLPQALAGVLAVLILYILVSRHFGMVAGLLAALALAVSPISVVTNRNNTIDSTLALTLLLGAWAIIRAAETGKWRWLLLAALAVGLGFNVKMLEAYLVVPAFGLLYLLCAPRKFWMRLLQLFVAVLLLLIVSFSWALIVDAIPAASRPYIGSSQDNSEVSLALGYNGTQRLLGQNGFGGGNGRGGGGFGGAGGNGDTTRQRSDFDFPGFGGSDSIQDIVQDFQNGGNGFNMGNAGPLRLFNEPLGGQIVWLLPVALLAILALAWQGRPRFRENRQLHSLILWGTWLLTMSIFFSVAGFFHQYYMTVFAPAICALFGIGIVVMWRDFQRGNWRGWLLPLALLATGLEQIHIITSDPDWGTWLIPLIYIACGLVAVALVVVRLLPHLHLNNPRIVIPLVGLALVALLLAPAIWSAVPGIQNQEADLPTAGPGQSGRFAGFGGSNTADTQLINYLEANQGTAKFLVATPSSDSADAIILATNKPVMAMGGFSGGDPILTTSTLQALIANGTIRFFLLSGGGRRGGFGGFGGGSGQNSPTSWVEQNCTAVSASQWGSSSSNSGGFGGGGGFGGNSLYDCAPKK